VQEHSERKCSLESRVSSAADAVSCTSPPARAQEAETARSWEKCRARPAGELDVTGAAAAGAAIMQARTAVCSPASSSGGTRRSSASCFLYSTTRFSASSARQASGRISESVGGHIPG